MAALSFYSNFYSQHEQQQSSSSSSIDHQYDFNSFSPELSPDFFYLPPPQLFPDPVFDYFPNPVFDYFPTTPFFDDDAVSSFIFSDASPYFSTPAADQFVPLTAEEFSPFDQFEFNCPKRQRFMLEQSFCCGGGGNAGGGGPYFPPDHLPDLSSGRPWECGMDNAEMLNNNNGGCFMTQPSASPSSKPSSNLSAQTIAARERRRKITAKTQELGELIPGGSKMNTAEMLNSAFKYIKFLQAQSAILQTEQKTEEETEHETENQLQILESSIIQEKLYSHQKCLVPKGFLLNLANSSEIQSHPSIFDSINQILHNDQIQTK